MANGFTPLFSNSGQSIVPEIQRGKRGEKGEKGDKGDTGESGVYVGTTEPTDPEVKVWLNPEGSTYNWAVEINNLEERASDLEDIVSEISRTIEDL